MFNTPLTKVYPVIFTPEEEGGYFIEFPDIQGSYTGIRENDIALGLEMAEEVLGMVLSDLVESNEPLPNPTPVNQVEHSKDQFVSLVRVNIEDYIKDNSLVRKNLTIPAWADKLGQKEKINFSKLLTDAVAEVTINKKYNFYSFSMSNISNESSPEEEMEKMYRKSPDEFKASLKKLIEKLEYFD